jgi:hypothetical protein
LKYSHLIILNWIVDGSWANAASGDKPNWVDTQNEVVKRKKDCVLTVLMDKSFLR